MQSKSHLPRSRRSVHHNQTYVRRKGRVDRKYLHKTEKRKIVICLVDVVIGPTDENMSLKSSLLFYILEHSYDRLYLDGNNRGENLRLAI